MWLLTLSLTLAFTQTPQTQTPSPTEGDFVIRNFTFTSGEALPELRMHYRTYGTPRKDAQGIVRNAVLIMHGTGGTGAQFAGRSFAGELFGPGQPLDTTRYFIILPDGIGHGPQAPPTDTTFAGKRLVMHVRQCEADEIRIPFHVGDDKSRTWVMRGRTEARSARSSRRMRTRRP